MQYPGHFPIFVCKSSAKRFAQKDLSRKQHSRNFAFPPGPAIFWAFFQFLFAKVLRKNLGLSKTWVSVSGSYAMSAEADMGI